MIIDNITREQFQAYSQVQDKERKKERYETKNNTLYGMVTLSGVTTIIAAGSAALGLSSEYGNDFLTGIMGVLTFVNGGFLYSHIRTITENSREMGKLEKEIEQLKAKPEYLAVVPLE